MEGSRDIAFDCDEMLDVEVGVLLLGICRDPSSPCTTGGTGDGVLDGVVMFGKGLARCKPSVSCM